MARKKDKSLEDGKHIVESLPQWCPYSHMTGAIISLFFCFPLAVPGIVYAARVYKLWLADKKKEAVRAADIAKRWSRIAFATGVVLLIAWVLTLVIYFVALIVLIVLKLM